MPQQTCAECGADIQLSFKHCPGCGAPNAVSASETVSGSDSVADADEAFSPGEPPTSSADRNDAFIWGIVALPIVATVIEVVVGYEPGVFLLLGVLTIGGNTALAIADMQANPSIERAPNRSRGGLIAAAALLVPVYLWLRATAISSGRAPFWLHLAAVVGTIWFIVASGALNQMDIDKVERQIEMDIALQTGASVLNVEIDCPEDQPARAGHRFVCDVYDHTPVVGGFGARVAGVSVEVLNSDGDFEWVAR